jgi:hypothetical protein
MSTKQLLAEIERGIKALQKAHALCMKREAVAPKAKATAPKTASTKTAKVTKVPAKEATKSGISDESRAKMAAAQQKRWAKIRRAKKKAAKAAVVAPAAE